MSLCSSSCSREPRSHQGKAAFLTCSGSSVEAESCSTIFFLFIVIKLSFCQLGKNPHLLLFSFLKYFFYLGIIKRMIWGLLHLVCKTPLFGRLRLSTHSPTAYNMVLICWVRLRLYESQVCACVEAYAVVFIAVFLLFFSNDVIRPYPLPLIHIVVQATFGWSYWARLCLRSWLFFALFKKISVTSPFILIQIFSFKNCLNKLQVLLR